MSTVLYLITIGVIPLTFLVIFAMKYLAAIQSARAQAIGQAAYRTLAETVVIQQNATEATLAQVRTELTRLAASVAQIEIVLKQVE